MAEESFFYVAGSEGIYRDSLETGTGKLGPLSLVAKADHPNFLALSPDGRCLYASLNHTVASFAVHPDGALTPLNERPSGGGAACYVSVDGTGHYVFVANYDGGNIACFQLNGDGALGERTALMPFTGSGPDPKRQKKPHAHSVYTDAGNKFVYACDLGSDKVWIFKFDPARGALAPNDPPSVKVPSGGGPRHLAFHPNGPFVYVANELGFSVTVFSRDAGSGALSALQTVSTLPPGTPTQGVTIAEIVCHPSGKWLYVSNRGCDTISVFSIAADGRLSLVQSRSSVARFPRHFAVDPSGCWLIAAGQKDNRIAVLKIDPATGKLSATDQLAGMASPICVLFAAGKN